MLATSEMDEQHLPIELVYFNFRPQSGIILEARLKEGWFLKEDLRAC